MKYNRNLFNLKLLLLFIVPITVFVYFSYLYIEQKLIVQPFSGWFILWSLSLLMVIISIFCIFHQFKLKEKNIENTQLLSHIFEAQEAIIVLDAKGVILRTNTAFSTITGYDSKEVAGKSLIHYIFNGKKQNKIYKLILHELQKKGKWQGEIYCKRKNNQLYPALLSVTSVKNKKNIILYYIVQFSDIFNLKKEQKRLRYQVEHDQLTHLLNRKALLQRLGEEFSKAKRHNFTHAFLFIDLDNFKYVNDNYGHHIGDKVLIEVAKRLKKSVRKSDIVARISGDEFAIILLNLNNQYGTNKDALQQIDVKILNLIASEMICDNIHLTISASIGIEFFPRNDTKIDDIMIKADKAMYKAKKSGKNMSVS